MSADGDPLGAVGAAEVLIPHWNRAESLRRTLLSLRRQTRVVPVRVIDNGSTDGTRSMLEREFPEARCSWLGANLGFGAALNRGARESSAELLVFLNNDTVADERFVEELLATQAETGAEMAAACLRRPDGSVESLGVELDRSLIAYDACHGEPYERVVGRPPEPPLAPSAGAAAYAREAFLSVGGFDEGFFAYLEDVDLGIRMRMAGMRCALAARAVAWHEHSGTLGSGSRAKNRLMGASRGYLLQKHGANVSRSARARGFVIDAAVYAGQALIDRNLGAVEGRIAVARRCRERAGPKAGFASVPLVDRSFSEALRLRLGRRLPVPGRTDKRRASRRLGARG